MLKAHICAELVFVFHWRIHHLSDPYSVCNATDKFQEAVYGLEICSSRFASYAGKIGAKTYTLLYAIAAHTHAYRVRVHAITNALEGESLS